VFAIDLRQVCRLTISGCEIKYFVKQFCFLVRIKEHCKKCICDIYYNIHSVNQFQVQVATVSSLHAGDVTIRFERFHDAFPFQSSPACIPFRSLPHTAVVSTYCLSDSRV
jgi:hypothetical protein